MYNCTSTEWCCDQGLVDHGCCSASDNLLNLGVRRFETTVGVAGASTLQTGVSTPSRNSENTLDTSSYSPTTQAPRPAASTSSSPPTAVSQQSSPTGTSSAPRSPSPPSGNDLGVKVGTGVGEPSGGALIAAVAYILYLRHEQAKQTHEEIPGFDVYTQEAVSPVMDEPQMLDGKAANGHELDGEGRKVIAQLPGNRNER